ncbi:MAG: hypothetical protein JW791_00050 [Nanoarchaeota archaeon]|nr:hypothetical protein [Nanoarchaeota archaeon]
MAEEQQNERPVFKTIKSFEKTYGTRNFIEVALKNTNEGENIFFSISKGFTSQNGVKRYKKSLGFAASQELQEFLVDALSKLLEEYKKLPNKPEDKKAAAAPAPAAAAPAETAAPAKPAIQKK